MVDRFLTVSNLSLNDCERDAIDRELGSFAKMLAVLDSVEIHNSDGCCLLQKKILKVSNTVFLGHDSSLLKCGDGFLKVSSVMGQ